MQALTPSFTATRCFLPMCCACEPKGGRRCSRTVANDLSRMSSRTVANDLSRMSSCGSSPVGQLGVAGIAGAPVGSFVRSVGILQATSLPARFNGNNSSRFV